MQWIRNLYRRLRKPAPDERPDEEKPPVHAINRDGLRAAVFTGRRCCEHLGHLVALQRWDHHEDEWHPAILVFDDELLDAMDLLSQARNWIRGRDVAGSMIEV